MSGCFYIFFFKQKTAYEMRISDWSSDVCSSDLETAELGGQVGQINVPAAPVEPGLYRTVTGAESIAFGLVAGAQLANVKMFFGGYPITPASAILHHLSRLKEFGITTFQAEDEKIGRASCRERVCQYV